MAKFKLKLLRISEDEIPTISSDMFIGEPTVARLDYNETINDIKVQYTKRVFDNYLRITQEAIEVLMNTEPQLRPTQEVLEILLTTEAELRITQDALEILMGSSSSISSSSSSRSSSSISSSSSSRSSESSSSSSKKPCELRITHIAGEVLRVGDPNVRITHIAGEVLRESSSSSLSSSSSSSS